MAAAVAGLMLFAACAEVEPLTTQQAMERLEVATTKVLAADGSLIANLHGEINRDIVPLAQIPAHVQDGVIAIEDRRFWTHAGLDLRAISRALITNVNSAGGEGGGIQGGSTVSQQLVKNLYFPEPSRTLERKLAEARLTVHFESQYSKERILEMYLNTVYFGRGVYGIQTAAQSWFRRDVADLTVAEAAFLAGVIHEPARYEWSESDARERREARQASGTARRNLVLAAMAELGLITPEQHEQARSETLQIHPPREAHWQHPYFVDMVLRELGVLRTNRAAQLDPRFDFLGETPAERSQKVYRGGLRIHTTLDPKAQLAAEEAVAEALPEDLPKLFASLAAVEPETGYVRALVGGRDYYPTGCNGERPDEEGAGAVTVIEASEEDDEEEPAERPECELGKVNLALGESGGGSGRQTGSSFKIMALAAGLERGVSLMRSFSASPFSHRFGNGQEWKVSNYEGSGGGHLNLVDATVRSVNASYARLVIDGIGKGDALEGSAAVADLSRRLGFPFDTPEELRERCGDEYGKTGRCTAADDVPSSVLGSKESSPLDMAAGYATFAAEGTYARPTSIVRVTDSSGSVLYDAEPELREAIPRDVALGVTHVLQQAVARGTGVRARIGRPQAGKTGTSQEWRDAWFVGYVPQLVASVWVGNPIPAEARDGRVILESMIPRNGYPIRVVGGSYPAMIWKAFMEKALEGVPSESFAAPPRSLFIPQAAPGDELDEELSPEELTGELEATPQPTPASPDVPRSPGSPGSRGSGTVPNVIGMSHGQANVTLSHAGYRSGTVYECNEGAGGLRVWNQSPGGGSQAPPGSTVTIWVNPSVC